MNKRPISVTIIGWVYIAAGIIGIVYHAGEFNVHDPFGNDLVLALFVRCLAIVGGVFSLRGANWGRWLLVAWLAFHVGLSVFHSLSQVAMHALLFVVIAFFLFQQNAAAYFGGAKAESAQPPKTDDAASI